MDWFYTQMLQLHVVLAWCSLGLFLLRGLAYQFGAAWAKEGQVLIIVFGVNTLLAVTGLSLWSLIHFNPLTRDPWLLLKLLALGGYFASGHWAMGRGEFRLLGFLIALALMAYMMALSLTRQPLLGL